MLKTLTTSLLLFGVIIASKTWATPIVYTVDQTVGTGTVIGTITTDGVLGTVTSSDITGWAFTLFDGTNTLSISQGSPSAITQAPTPPSTDLTATSTDLLFNFSSTDNAFLILGLPTVPGSGGEVTWQASGVGIHIYDIDGDGIFLNTPTLSGIQVIASVADVPEPTTLTLILSTLGLLLMMMPKRRSALSAH